MAGGGLADGEGVGAVCAGGGGAEVVPGAGGAYAEEDDLSAGEGGAVGRESAGEGEGLIDGGVGVGGGEGEGGLASGSRRLSLPSPQRECDSDPHCTLPRTHNSLKCFHSN